MKIRVRLEGCTHRNYGGKNRINLPCSGSIRFSLHWTCTANIYTTFNIACMHAVKGCYSAKTFLLKRSFRENLYPRNIPAIWYILKQILHTPCWFTWYSSGSIRGYGDLINRGLPTMHSCVLTSEGKHCERWCASVWEAWRWVSR